MLFGKKDKFDGGQKLLKAVNGTHIVYAAERTDDSGSEKILGKNGAVVVTDEKVTILCGGKSVFSCKPGQLKCGMLQSGNGAVFSGTDIVSGRFMTVTAYFTSHINIYRT